MNMDNGYWCPICGFEITEDLEDFEVVNPDSVEALIYCPCCDYQLYAYKFSNMWKIERNE